MSDSIEVVYICGDFMEMERARSILEDGGILVFSRDLASSPYPVAVVTTLSDKELYVDRDDAARAREILREAAKDGVLPEGSLA